MKTALIVAAVALFLLGILVSVDVPTALVLGWLFFLVDVLPRITVHWPSVLVGVIALVLFTVGVHRLGRAWRRPSAAAETGSVPWNLRSSLAVVGSVVVLFASGVAIVGIAHQFIWLLASDRPLLEPGAPLIFSGVKGAAAARTQTRNNMKQIALSFHSHDAYKKFPDGVWDSQGNMLHSWETTVLAGFMYSTSGIDMTRPWNDPVNQKYFKCMLPEFINLLGDFPVFDAAGYGLNHFSANIHVIGPNRPVKTFSDIKDGTANTLLLGEVSTHFRPWAQPGNWRDPALGLNRFPGGFGGPEGDGAYFALADGSVKFLKKGVSLTTLRALSTPAGGEKVGDWE